MVNTQVFQGTIHPDTQAVLRLCGIFAKEGGSEAKPLTPTEYNALALWLSRHGRRPADLLKASEDFLPAEEAGLPQVGRLRALLGRGLQMAAALERWQRLGLWVISRGETCYPERLRNLRSASPPLLYGAGDATRLALGGLAVVGSRDIDEEGLSFTRRVAERCAGNDTQVVSGGARGVDQASVAAVLEAGGGAVVVLAERLDRAATSRDAKEHLRRGLLTLSSPYEPESSFSVGKAMGRNKHIYALADSALVVRFTTGEGGTWAGAVEQLGRNGSGSASKVVFVRLTNNPEEGCRELRRRGALPFPEEEFWKGDVTEMLSGAALPAERADPNTASDPAVIPPPVDESSAAMAKPPTPASETALAPPELTPPSQAPIVGSIAANPEPDTCYGRCLPLLLRYLREEPGKKQLPEIAKQLDVLPKQLETWLRRALGEGKAMTKKKGRKIVYADASGEGRTLFNRGGDAA